MFRQKCVDGFGEWSGEITLLTNEEILLVSGGDDGGAGCSPSDSGADGNCAAQGDASSGESVGSLPETTVTASSQTIGDAEAAQMVQNIDLALNNPVFAAALFVGTIANFFANAAPSGPIGNPGSEGP
ncbi:hypothetical protein [Variovorax sp. ZT4R33]|uniref:hypothetical protein n=1 Tax=Variovorax sp. ZT4R33 TaxID=3443743 RepID=UPI003F47BF0F